MSTKQPNITLFFLGASRAIRIAWLLEELQLPYKLVVSPRAPNGLASPEFKKIIPTKLGKSPVITDGDIVVQESSAIVEYICEAYDVGNRLIPNNVLQRVKTREWMAAAEGTFMIHGLAILYARWRIPEPAKPYLPEMEKGLSANMHNDLDWLEEELANGGGKFLVGDSLTAADIMMGFTVEFILKRQLGTQGGTWPHVVRWLDGLMQVSSFKAAVEKTGYSL